MCNVVFVLWFIIFPEKSDAFNNCGHPLRGVPKRGGMPELYLHSDGSNYMFGLWILFITDKIKYLRFMYNIANYNHSPMFLWNILAVIYKL